MEMAKVIVLLKEIQTATFDSSDKNPGIEKLDHAIKEMTHALVEAVLAKDHIILDTLHIEGQYTWMYITGIPAYHPDPAVNLRVAQLIILSNLACQFLNAIRNNALPRSICCR